MRRARGPRRRAAARSMTRWLWSMPSDEPVAGAGGRPRDARDDGRRAGRPAVTGGKRRGKDQPGPRRGHVADGLGDIPVALPTGQREGRRPAAPSTTSLSAAAVAAELRDRAGAVPAPDRRRTSRRTLRNRSSSMPRQAATMSGAAGSSASTQAGRSSVAVRHLQRLRPAPEPPHRDDPDRRAEREHPERDPPCRAVAGIERADDEDRDRGEQEARARAGPTAPIRTYPAARAPRPPPRTGPSRR